MEAVNGSCEEIRVSETGCNWWAETKEFLERFEEIFESIRFALIEALHNSLAEPCRSKKVFFHLGRLFLQPDEDGVKRSHCPILICQQTDIEL